METFIHADIFFFITSVAVILLTIGLIIALAYVIKILHNVKHVSEKVREGSDQVMEDITVLRGHIRQEGFKVKYVASFFKSFFGKKAPREKKE